ncbi:MAG: DUF6036 family nucleotidyltransferase [Planctomycetota bacterium]|nr:DUF6036 family nucleotidyltransferase [Planctomycetota bacterium]
MAVLNDSTIRTALAKLGERLRLDRDVEILLVGGAAGVLIGQLPAAWTTADVDVIHCRLPQDRDAVMAAAEEVGRELSLPPSWLSEDVGLYAWTLPEGWEYRRVHVLAQNHLRVYAASRLDLIAMKFVAHRERDLEHLFQMRVRTDELSFVRDYLDALVIRHPNESGRIEMARQYVDGWEVQS